MKQIEARPLHLPASLSGRMSKQNPWCEKQSQFISSVLQRRSGLNNAEAFSRDWGKDIVPCLVVRKTKPTYLRFKVTMISRVDRERRGNLASAWCFLTAHDSQREVFCSTIFTQRNWSGYFVHVLFNMTAADMIRAKQTWCKIASMLINKYKWISSSRLLAG